ncbi:FHA domain-containing protein [Patescibacteria group bacterium]|nr:FHA domain-containing protein [Patescibacteria group bacterium]
MSRNQVSIKVDEKGSVVVKDLKSKNKTVLRKEI